MFLPLSSAKVRFGTGGRKNLLTDYRFSIYIAENENCIRCENVISMLVLS